MSEPVEPASIAALPPGDSQPSSGLDITRAASLEVTAVLDALGSSTGGLASAEAARRLEVSGPNALRSHGARPLSVLARQLRNPLLLLLLGAAAVSGATGDLTDAVIIAVIVAVSVGLGFFNEFRSEQAVEALHSRIRHQATLLRDGKPSLADVVDLVPGDIVFLKMGDLVPADLRLVEVDELECDEAVLTGEPAPAPKSTDPLEPTSTAQPANCASMGTIVHQGTGRGVVIATGAATAFGKIALGLSDRPPETAFQVGLRRFSLFLVKVAAILTTGIFVANLVLRRPFLDALLFSLAIAIGLTPQLLPAIVTVSLSTGSRRLGRLKVLVKRLVSIEDLGNITTLFTDKTGTLTEGRITFQAAIDAAGASSPEAFVHALVCNEAILDQGLAVSGNQIDMALWDGANGTDTVAADGSATALRWRRLGSAPFDHTRRLASVVADDPDGTRWLVTKGEPERVLASCRQQPAPAEATLQRLFDEGARVIAVARRPAAGMTAVQSADEHDLEFIGFLVFSDPPKASAADSLRRLAALGIEVKVITGDSDRVARTVCERLGLAVTGTLTGDGVDSLDDAQLAAAIPETTVFARIGPDQKSRIVSVQRASGADVAFLGDGVNDAVALHHADVGISVDTATDVAKDAADILLLENDLGVLADGVVEGRRIFANTIKYVLMATSSNFGNMFSAAGASLFLKFLPMLPSQILLNNLLYDVGQMTIPTDRVDDEQLARPSQWDIRFIRRFMAVFGPLSSIFDFATFAILLSMLHASTPEFRTGWFIESLATQTLIVFVIRTRRIPFFRSRPSGPVLATTVTMAAIGAILPFTPLAGILGFTRLPVVFFAILAALIAAYLAIVEVAKGRFYAVSHVGEPVGTRHKHERRIHRRAARFSHAGPVVLDRRPPRRRRRRRS